jgi:hypothetical protein
MQGRRLYCNDDGLFLDKECLGKPLQAQPGDYWDYVPQSTSKKQWAGRCPNGLYCNLAAHQIQEHEDGTITVSPSILVKGHATRAGNDQVWHGYLEKGTWREV